MSESGLGIASVIESSICLKNVGKRYAAIERILIERRKSKSLVIAPAVTRGWRNAYDHFELRVIRRFDGSRFLSKLQRK